MKPFLAVGALLITSLLTGCSLKSASSSTLRIVIPESSHADRSKAQTSALTSVTASTAPLAISEFTCYGVNVTGPGIASGLNVPSPTPNASPTPEPLQACKGPGVMAGLVSATSGGTIVVDVPSGPDRIVQIFGIKTTDGTCPKIQDLTPVTFLSTYELGRSRVDVTADTNVTIAIQYNPNLPQPLLCGGASTKAGMNLEVPIELLDSGLSNTGGVAAIFDRTRTSLDTTDYDGTVSYEFEIVATNTSASSAPVGLVDDANTGIASSAIGVSGGTTTPTRFRQPFTPTAGPHNYRIELTGPGSGYTLNVYAARILVKQVNATKTKIYIPLIADKGNTIALNNVDASTASYGAVNSTTATYPYSGISAQNSIWQKNSTAFATLAPGTPWTFETVTATSSTGGIAYASLYNTTDSQPISNSATSNTSTTPTLRQSSFSDSESYFGDSKNFEVKLSTSNASYAATIYKAGLWVKLINLSKAESYYRFGRRGPDTTGSSNGFSYARTLLDLGFFSNPTLFYEAIGVSGTTAGTTGLCEASTNDSGISCTDLSGSNQNIPTFGKARIRSAALTGFGNGNRIIQHYSKAAGGSDTLEITSSFAIVHAEK